MTWLKGSFLPAAVTFAVIPALVYVCFPPELKKTPEAPAMARAKLKELGPMTSGEYITMITLTLAVALWVRIGTLLLHCCGDLQSEYLTNLVGWHASRVVFC